MTSSNIVAHPRPQPTPPRGIRVADYIGRHRLPDPAPRPSRWQRAVAALAAARMVQR